jgi:hypothetical protein
MVKTRCFGREHGRRAVEAFRLLSQEWRKPASHCCDRLGTGGRVVCFLIGPQLALVRNLAVAKVDSIGFVVRRWIQCPAG